MTEKLDNHGNDLWVPLEKYEDLGKDVKCSCLQRIRGAYSFSKSLTYRVGRGYAPRLGLQ